jgi:hypothetical protein
MPHIDSDRAAEWDAATGQQRDPVLGPYLAATIERQLREQARAAEKFAAFERNHIRIFLPHLTPEGERAIENYANALAKQHVARDALVKAGFKP